MAGKRAHCRHPHPNTLLLAVADPYELFRGRTNRPSLLVNPGVDSCCAPRLWACITACGGGTGPWHAGAIVARRGDSLLRATTEQHRPTFKGSPVRTLSTGDGWCPCIRLTRCLLCEVRGTQYRSGLGMSAVQVWLFAASKVA